VPDLSVIIVNWNSKDYVRQCLKTLFMSCQGMRMEVIVVDGGSFDGCAEMLAREFPKVFFIQMDQNVGFARANNAGFERSTGKFVWLLNPDTEVVGPAAATLLQTLQSRNDIGMVGARLLNSDGSLQTSCVQSLPTPLNQALDSEILRRIFPKLGLWGIVALQSQSQPVEVEAVSGACMMLRREDFERVGRFNPGYFMYGEDMDLCLKIHRAGLKIVYVPEAEVRHHGGGSSQKQSSKFSAVLMREAVTFYLSSNFSIFHAWFYRFCMAVSALSRIAALLAFRLVARSESKVKNFFSLQKWIAILKWSFGGERWARAHSRES
jgi:N-acetylglucosaminyl-diphospho-decaprenol L-rhamnosyltransferase